MDLRRALDEASGAGVVVRVVLPTLDAATTTRVLGATLSGLGWPAAPPPPGLASMHMVDHGRAHVGIAHDARSVVIDVFFPASPQEGERAATRGREALVKLRARAAGGPHEEPPALEGNVAVARYGPAAFADLGLIGGAAETLRSLDAPRLDAAQRDANASVGLRSAAIAQKLAATQSAAYFDGVEMTLGGAAGSLHATLRARPGPAMEIPAAPWAPSPALRAEGTVATIDYATAWERSWTPISADYPTNQAFLEAVREAGWVGTLVALPQKIALDFSSVASALRSHPGVRDRAERIAIVAFDERTSSEVEVALFPPELKPADLACAVAEDAACPAAIRLSPGRTATNGYRFYRLVRVKDRWAIVASLAKADLERTKLTIGPAMSPVYFAAPGAKWLSERLAPLPAGLFAERYLAEIVLEGGAPVAHIRPVR